MSIPPTLVLPRDEEQTVVDSRSQPRPQAQEPSPRLVLLAHLRRLSGLRFTWLRAVGLFVLAALLIVMSTVALLERDKSERLHQANEQLRREREAWLTTALGYDEDEERDSTKERSGFRHTPANETSHSRDELEQRGAALLVANDYRAAIEHYETMSKQFPGEPVFSRLVQILRARLNCPPGRLSRASPCR